MPLTDEVTVSTPESAAFSLETAGLGSRFLALFIDMIIQAVLTALLVYSYDLLTDFALFYDRAMDVIDAVFLALLAVVLGLYHLIFEAVTRGRSPGKWAIGLRVVKTTGVPVGFWESCLRNLVRLIDFLPAGYLVGIVSIFATAQSRRLGDLAAGTIVVRERRLATRPVMEGTGSAQFASGMAAGQHRAAAAQSVPAAGPTVSAAAHADPVAAHADPVAAQPDCEAVPPGSDQSGAAVPLPSLTYREEELIAEFLSRRHGLAKSARADLARRLADRLHAAGISPATFGLPSYTDDETLLQTWYEQRQR